MNRLVIFLAAMTAMGAPATARPIDPFEGMGTFTFKPSKQCENDVCVLPKDVMIGILVANEKLQDAVNEANESLAEARKDRDAALALVKRKCTAKLEVIPNRRS